jgi:hemoglobin
MPFIRIDQEAAVKANPSQSSVEGIDRELIARVVQRFYARVRGDAVLGPIFNPRVEDWPEHETKITRFWSSVLLMSGEYHGSPMQVHLGIPDLGRADFDRWLALFDQALASSCNADQATAFRSRAARIAQAFQFARASQGPVPRLTQISQGSVN